MVCGALLVFRVAVGQIHHGAQSRLVESTLHFALCRSVGQLVGQRQTAGACFVEEALVVQATIKRRAPHLRIIRIAIGESRAVHATAKTGGSQSVAIHIERSNAGRQSDRTFGIQVVAQRQITHGKRHLHLRRRLRGHQRRHLSRLLPFHGRCRLTGSLLAIGHIGTVRQFALLTTDKGTTAQLTVTGLHTQGTVISIQTTLATHHGRHLLIHDDVQHTGTTLSIVLGTGVGDHLNRLHHGGRHGLEHLTGSRRHHHVGFSVDIHLERAGTIDSDVILAVNADHRHLAQHVEHGRSLGVGIVLHVIRQFVGISLHQAAHAGHCDTVQVFLPSHAVLGCSLLSGCRVLPSCHVVFLSHHKGGHCRHCECKNSCFHCRYVLLVSDFLLQR